MSKTKSAHNRHRSRELVAQWIYQWNLNRSQLEDLQAQVGAFWAHHGGNPEDENYPFFERLALGVIEALPKIDESIEGLLRNYKLSRVEKVDLSILRVGVFEILFDQSDDRPDVAVIINEAVEIAKKYGSKDSPSFVNGILDRVQV